MHNLCYSHHRWPSCGVVWWGCIFLGGGLCFFCGGVFGLFVFFSRSSNSLESGLCYMSGMRLCWPGACWQPVLLAWLDKVCRGALVADFGGLLYHPDILPANLGSLAPALRPWEMWLWSLCETLLQCPPP